MGLNIPGYTLFSVGGVDCPRACILARNTNAWMLPRLSCRYLVAVLINSNGEAERRLVSFSAYLPHYSVEPTPSTRLRNICDTVKKITSIWSQGVG